MFRFNNRYIYIIIAILVATSIIGRLSSQSSMIGLLLTLPAILIAITFHEFAHALAADKLGDDTPRMQGRLTLNPLAHIDFVGFALLIVAGFGWGKPVQVNPANFKRNISTGKGEAIVSVAGPLANFIIAIITTIVTALMFKLNWVSNLSAQTLGIVLAFQIELVLINIGLGLFNLIPLPPLDGSKILVNILPYNSRNWLIEHEQIFRIVFVAIWVTGIAGTIISPCIYGVTRGIFSLVGNIFNVNLLGILRIIGL